MGFHQEALSVFIKRMTVVDSTLANSALFFDRQGDHERDMLIESRLKEADNNEKEKRIFCASCGQVITHQDERITVQGGHEHRFANPHRIEFHIGCFRQAHGCTQMGERTKEWTWFASHAWQIALCGQCRTHLGWRFDSPDSGFYGLILDRLTSRGPAG